VPWERTVGVSLPFIEHGRIEVGRASDDSRSGSNSEDGSNAFIDVIDVIDQYLGQHAGLFSEG